MDLRRRGALIARELGGVLPRSARALAGENWSPTSGSGLRRLGEVALDAHLGDEAPVQAGVLGLQLRAHRGQQAPGRTHDEVGVEGQGARLGAVALEVPGPELAARDRREILEKLAAQEAQMEQLLRELDVARQAAAAAEKKAEELDALASQGRDAS